MENVIRIYELDKVSRTGESNAQTKPNEIRFSNPANQAPRIAINRVLTKELMDKGHNCMNFARNEITGDFYFVFGKTGYEMRVSKRANNQVNYEIGVHAIWKLFSELNGLRNDQSGAAFLSNDLSKSEDNSTYLVEKIVKFYTSDKGRTTKNQPIKS